MPTPLSRRALLGAPAALLSIFQPACHSDSAPTPMARDLSYGPSASQRLDTYASAQQRGLRPLVLLMHGGGWERGSRDDMAPFIARFTSRSYVVANIGYRLAAEAPAPAAVEDVRNAIEWVRLRAAGWGADGRRILLAGFSAGAHLALLAALAPASAFAGPPCRARAIMSFWGITDLADLLGQHNPRDFARRWIPESPARLELARRLSPIEYDVTDAPALCAIHSLYDDVVPFAHSERLVAKFQHANRPAKLIRLSHRGHAAPDNAYPAMFSEAFRFLDGTGVMA